jgi:putative FmdB family regulatory protein
MPVAGELSACHGTSRCEYEEVDVPRYQYACTVPECGHEFEAVQSFSDDPLTSCPACEGRLRKVFGAVGVVFKGSGFYRTDSRADSRGGRDERAGSAEKSGTDSSGADNNGKGGGATKSSDKDGDAKGSASTGSSGSQSSASGSTKAAAARSA